MSMLHGASDLYWPRQPFGKLLVASCSYLCTILWHHLSVWFLMDSHWLIHKLIFKKLCVCCWQEWTEFWLHNTESKA